MEGATAATIYDTPEIIDNNTQQFVYTAILSRPAPGCTSDAVTSDVVTVYPNPASEVLNIQGFDPVEVQVFNALGQLVKTIKNENQINVSGWAEGVYVLRIATADGKTFERKVTVKR